MAGIIGTVKQFGKGKKKDLLFYEKGMADSSLLFIDIKFPNASVLCALSDFF